MKLELSWQIFEKYDVKFHKNPSSGSRAVPCGQTVLTKPTVASRNFAKAFKKNKSVCKMYLQQRDMFHDAVLPVVGPPVLAWHFRCSGDWVLLFDAVCKSEHAVHITSGGRMTGDWEGAGLKLLWLHLRTNPIFVYINWRKTRKTRQCSRWCGEEKKKSTSRWKSSTTARTHPAVVGSPDTKQTLMLRISCHSLCLNRSSNCHFLCSKRMI